MAVPTPSQPWREITIDRKKIVDAERISNGRVRFVDHERSADECHTGEGLVRQIGEALEAGVRVLLVAIRDCEGGDVVAAEAVYRSLRAFASNPVRRVIVHVSGFAASTAAHVALAGDYLLVDPDGKFHLHGAIVNWPNDPEGGERSRLAANARTSAVMRERSAMPELGIENAMAARYDPTSERPFNVMTLLPDLAVQWRWADMISDLGGARRLAGFLAGGGAMETPRTAMLRERAQRPQAECTIVTGIVQTSNYTQDGSGNPTAGAKLDYQGTALKVAPANFQIGSTLIRDAWFGRVRPAILNEFRHNSGSWTWLNSEPKTSTGEWSFSYNATSNQLSVTLLGWVTKGLHSLVLSGATQSAFTPPDPSYFVTSLSTFGSGADLICVLQMRKTTVTYNSITGEYELVSAVADWRGAGVPRFNLAFTALAQTWWEW